MYNRYIPQPDGSFRRRPMQDRSNTQDVPKRPPSPPAPQPSIPEPSKEAVHKPTCPHLQPSRPYRPLQRKPEPETTGIGSFLRQLMPKDFDTADLIVVLLLLLMSADSSDDNSALLTLALYLFM